MASEAYIEGYKVGQADVLAGVRDTAAEYLVTANKNAADYAKGYRRAWNEYEGAK